MACVPRNKPGYIVITTLLLLTGLSIIVVGLLRVSWTAQEFSTFARDRIHAYALARSGIAIAQSQLAYPHNQQDQKQRDQQQNQPNNQQQAEQQGQEQQQDTDTQYVLQLLQYINRWQALSLTQEQDGIDGDIYLYIAPEPGKIPLNAIFDRENKRLTQAAQSIVPQLQEVLSGQGYQGELSPALEEIAQKPPYFDDPTQLLSLHSAFAFFDDRRFVQLDPTQQAPRVWKVPTLMDLTTVHIDKKNIAFNPLFFSRSVCAMFGITPFPQDQTSRSQMVESMRQQMPSQVNWEQHWDTLLAPYYGKQFAEIPQALRDVLTTEHGVHRFSVVSYAGVRGTYVYLYAIIERVEGEQHDTFRVHRMYWV